MSDMQVVMSVVHGAGDCKNTREFTLFVRSHIQSASAQLVLIQKMSSGSNNDEFACHHLHYFAYLEECLTQIGLHQQYPQELRLMEVLFNSSNHMNRDVYD